MRRFPLTGWVGAALVAITVTMAVVALFWTPYDPVHAVPEVRLAGPNAEHLLGTDRFGRDVFSRIMAGSHITLYVGVVAVTIAAVIGVPLGILAAMRGGFVDNVVMRTADLMLAFPGLLLAIVAGAVWGPSTLTAMAAIGVAGVPSFARVARSGAMQILHLDFIASARVSKVPGPVIALRHIAPNIAGLVTVQATVFFALAILAEAGLSYLGLGTPAPAASWGRMLQDAQTLLGTHPLLALWPGLAIGLTVLGFNLLGDGLRDLLDPRLRGGLNA
ncbi:peptide ABC transporter permease [Corynebacterium phocae]|uniref:Peptide ABC transporter permease n=1 Tax=Corynebacterium phocae TaxID=161895 RepID=A0A1L7D1W7_9CORY|nr:ABC transporter permease [Corynebacterium phocae]APT92098.1 peptide ABC transporter permease [Corynebacterium phocae]KAA8726482.1 ABC transporter permease [Corynebacterium phocae]